MEIQIQTKHCTCTTTAPIHKTIPATLLYDTESKTYQITKPLQPWQIDHNNANARLNEIDPQP